MNCSMSYSVVGSGRRERVSQFRQRHRRRCDAFCRKLRCASATLRATRRLRIAAQARRWLRPSLQASALVRSCQHRRAPCRAHRSWASTASRSEASCSSRSKCRAGGRAILSSCCTRCVCLAKDPASLLRYGARSWCIRPWQGCSRTSGAIPPPAYPASGCARRGDRFRGSRRTAIRRAALRATRSGFH